MFAKFPKKMGFCLIAVLCLATLLWGTLPEFWFRRHLEKNWNVNEDETPAGLERGRRNRLCLIFAIDGVPHPMVEDLYKKGYFEGFYPPGRLVSTFPSLTRPAFSKMLIGGKPYGYERLYYNFNAHRVEGTTLVNKAFSTQKKHLDYHPKLHFLGFPGYIAYVFPEKFSQTAIDAFYDRLKQFEGDEFIAYMGISDAIAHVEGEKALIIFLKTISDLLETVRIDLGVSLDVVFFSDHANNFADNRRVDLRGPLMDAGFRLSSRLEGPLDVVLPENGFVSFAAVYASDVDAPAISRALAGVEGVDFAVYRSGNALHIRGSAGSARIFKRQERFRYHPLDGDPLDLEAALRRLKYSGKIDLQGFVHEKDWWAATQDHIYPDPLRRLWEGMHDLVQHPGTVLISMQDGYAFGPAIFNQPIVNPRAGTHGALLGSHSYGFLMTDFMPVDTANRPDDVAQLLGRAAEAKQSGIKRLETATQ